MNAESARVEHLRFIQDIIGRMARNSFAIKAASTTIVAALVAVALSANYLAAAFGGIPLVMFWLLDAFYLGQERLFRVLYNTVRRGPPPELGSEGYFSMDIKADRRPVRETLATMVTRTLLTFYVPLLTLLGLVALLARRG